MEESLRDQVAIVTGGSRGIGRAIVDLFAAKGARVLFFGTNSERGKAAQEELNSRYGAQATAFFSVDVSDTASVNTAVASILEEHGKVDLLVNNAGITSDKVFLKMGEEEWDRVISVNLKSCYNMCHAVMRSMMRARKGKIINMSSVVGLVGNPGQANYAASKAGIIGLTKALAREVASRQVCINCIAPGYIDSSMVEKMNVKKKEAILEAIPLKRMGKPEEVAKMALFLALSEYITGQVFIIDGGLAI